MFNIIHHFFIPSEHNNYRAKLLHIDSLSFLLGLAFFLSFSYNVVLAGPVGQVLGAATDITLDRLYELTNSQRTNNGLSSLNYNGQLASAACSKASYMFANNLWAHYGPDGTTPWSFILAAGYHYQYAGENLAKDFNSSSEVVDAWMNSPLHRENILRPEYVDVGYCAANGNLNGQETTLVVQMFGRPQESGQPVVNIAQAQTKPTAVPTIFKALAPTKKIVASPTINPTSPPKVIAVAQELPPPQTNISFLSHVPYNFTLLLFSMLMMALLADFYFAYHLGVVRIVGRHAAHFIFLSFMLIGLFIITKGVIL